MRKIILTYGIIAGLIPAGWLVGVLATTDGATMENGMWYGYASMILAFSLVFVAVKSFRDKFNQGHISFGKAFKIGLYITLIASTIYVLAWLIDYYFFVPDFMEKYTALEIDKLKASGISQTELEKKTTEMTKFMEMYKNPIVVTLFTYLEILPVGLAVTVITALVLKKKATA